MLKFFILTIVAGLAAAQWNSLGTSTSTASSLSNSTAAAANATSQNVSPLSQFFDQVLRGQVLGLRKCKKPKDCGLGLRCDLLLNLCVPFNTPILTDIEKQCSNETECSPMHSCQGGFCRFCGPKSCRSNFDCCTGSFAQPGKPARFFECLNLEDLEKQSLAAQLGRPTINAILPGGKSPEDAIESEELIQLGIGAQGDPAMYGKRCWARCNLDADCHAASAPEEIKKSLGCCNGVCTRRQSCVNVPQSAILLQQQQQQLAAQQLAQQQASAQQAALFQQQQQALGQQNLGGQQGGWGSHGHHLGAQLSAPQINQQPAQPVPLSWAQAQQQSPQQPRV